MQHQRVRRIVMGIILITAMLAAGAAAAQQSPYGNQPLTPPNSPYPQSPYGGQNQQPPPGYQQQPTPPGYQQQPPPGYQQQTPPSGYQNPPQQPAPQAGGNTLMDVLGRFRLNLPQGTAPVSATYAMALPQMGMQVNVMSVAQQQNFYMQQQNFPNLIGGLGGRISGRRQLRAGNRQALLMIAVTPNPQSGGQMMSYNVFISGANVWLQVMGPANNQSGIEQVTSQLLQALATR
jgi:hypothetical protein